MPAAMATPAPAKPHPGAMPERALLDFADTDIEAVARAMSTAMGRPIAVDPRVKGKLHLATDTPVSPAQAYALFTQALRGLGYAVIDSDGLLKIVPEADAKLQAAWSTGGAAAATPPSRGDLVATQVFSVVHESATNLVPVLRPLIGPNSTINVSAGRNALVITDYESNLRRLATLVAALDVPSATDVEVMPLEHALATELAPVVLKLSESAGAAAGAGAGGSGSGNNERAGGGGSSGTAAAMVGGSSGGTSVVAEPHLNALLVRAPNPVRLAAIRALVARLDQPGRSGAAGSNVHVVYLRNAEATRLATVLRAAFAAEAARGGGGGSNGSGSGGAAGTATPAPAATGGSALNLGSGSATSASGSTSAASTTPVSATAAPSTGGLVQADPASNALIVTAAEPLFRDMREVIERLDTPRAQLYVESLVVEVDASRSLDIGLQWKQIFNISSTTDLTLGTIAQIVESTAGTNILSTANVVTLDNEEAKIVVGQNVPFVTGSYTGTTGTTTSPFQTIERKDVGITLRIRPQIGERGRVRMTIFQESSSVASSTSPGTTNAGPTTNKRAIESTVVVDDGRIVVLGGLLEDSSTGSVDHVPGLGRLPLVGGIFSTTSRSRKKTNLVVFLRPVVMADGAARDALSIDRYDQIRARQQALPEAVPEALPDRRSSPALPAPDADGRVGPLAPSIGAPAPMTDEDADRAP